MIGQTMLAVPVRADGAARRVYDPATGRRLPDGGLLVAVSPYWVRRARAGDIRLEAPGKQAPAPKPAAQTEPEPKEAEAPTEESSAVDAAKKKPRKRGARGDA